MPQSSITWPEGDREVLRSWRGFFVLCSLKMAMAMKPAERLDFGGADRHLGTRGFSGTLSTRVGPPAALSGPTVLPRTKGAPSLAATPWRPWCGRCWSRWRTSGAGSGRRRPAAGAPAAAAVGGLGHRRLLLCRGDVDGRPAPAACCSDASRGTRAASGRSGPAYPRCP